MNEAKIFNEEELKAIETTFYQLCHYGTMSEATRDHAIEVIASHRSLFSANAELSFKNMKLKQAHDKCATGGNSLASVIIGWDLPKGWQDWTRTQANDFLYNLYGNSSMAYERYEIWLCWKSIKDAGQTLEELK